MSPLLAPLLAHAHFEDLSAVDWVLVGLAVLIGAWSIWLAVRYTVAPGEADHGHVKFSILDEPAVIHVTAAPGGRAESGGRAETGGPSPQRLAQASGPGAPASPAGPPRTGR